MGKVRNYDVIKSDSLYKIKQNIFSAKDGLTLRQLSDDFGDLNSETFSQTLEKYDLDPWDDFQVSFRKFLRLFKIFLTILKKEKNIKINKR